MEGRRVEIPKVPRITAYFWVLKFLTTAMGEAISDYSVNRIDPFIAVALGGVAFVVVLSIQLAVPRYVPWIYWLTVSAVAVFGTMCADALHVEFHVPYAASATLFAVVLAAVFFVWHATEHTLSIHSIVTTRREIFYWATVISTFALGTALGDLTATTCKLGYLSSLFVFAGLICVPGIAYRWLGLNAVIAFWFAYIVTRPLGASLSDYLSKPHAISGVGLGDGVVATILVVPIVAVVAYISVMKVDRQVDVHSPEVV